MSPAPSPGVVSQGHFPGLQEWGLGCPEKLSIGANHSQEGAIVFPTRMLVTVTTCLG